MAFGGSIPQPRLVSKLPVVELGDRFDPHVVDTGRNPLAMLFGGTGASRKRVQRRDGDPDRVLEPGAAKAEWAIAGVPGTFRSRQAAIQAYRRQRAMLRRMRIAITVDFRTMAEQTAIMAEQMDRFSDHMRTQAGQHA